MIPLLCQWDIDLRAHLQQSFPPMQLVTNSPSVSYVTEIGNVAVAFDWAGGAATSGKQGEC